MSNLLEKASILLTPTAYDDGKILSVKPEEVLGEELVVNGDFSDGSTSWNFGPGWSIVNENASHTGSGSYIEQGSLTQGVSYKVVINVTQASGSGFPQIYMGGLTTAMTSVGVYTFNIVAVANDKIKIRGLNDCEISSVSVKQEIDGDFDFTRNSSATRVNAQGLIEDVQILSSNLVSNGDFSQEGSELVTNGSFDSDSGWTLGTGWSIANGNANSDGVSSNSNLVTTSAFYSGSTPVKMTINVTDYVSGGLKVYLSSTNFTEITANGNYTFYTTADRTDGKLYLKSINFIGSIDNVSVKEVGQDWTLGIGWSIGANKVIGDGTMGGNDVVRQLINFSQGTTYRFSFTVLDYVSGGVFIRNPFNGFLDIASANGSYSFDYVAGINDYIDFRGNSFVGSITNISVLEITDDTNLPRINYDGFSYQDALGSELVVNGDFTTDSNWSKDANWSIANGKATSTGAGRMFQSIPFLEINIGTTVKVSFDITELTANSVVVNCYGGISESFTTVGTHTFITTTTNNTNLYFNNAGAGNLIGSIDNVSVKEYLGQEVVPDSGVGSWLFEPQSTNLVTYSEVYGSGTYFSSFQGSTFDNTTSLSPSGENNATQLTSTGDGKLQTAGISLSQNTDYTLSFYAKNVDATAVTSRVLGLGGSGGSNLTAISYFSELSTTEWKRITHSFNTGTNTTFYLYLSNALNSGGTIQIWGAQLEQSSFATSYIPTNGSTVTRLQDAAFGAGSSDLINSTEGVLYWEGVYFGASGNNLISVSESGSNNYVALFFLSGSTILSRYYNNGSIEGNISYGGLNTTDYFKIAFSWSQDNFSLWVNGVRRSLDTSGNIITPNVFNKINFGSVSNSQNFYGKTKCLAVFKEALTDEELTCLTTI